MRNRARLRLLPLDAKCSGVHRYSAVKPEADADVRVDATPSHGQQSHRVYGIGNITSRRRTDIRFHLQQTNLNEQRNRTKNQKKVSEHSGSVATTPSYDARRRPGLSKHLPEVTHEQVWLLVRRKVAASFVIRLEYNIPFCSQEATGSARPS